MEWLAFLALAIVILAVMEGYKHFRRKHPAHLEGFREALL
jgi:hypothetical protein